MFSGPDPGSNGLSCSQRSLPRGGIGTKQPDRPPRAIAAAAPAVRRAARGARPARPPRGLRGPGRPLPVPAAGLLSAHAVFARGRRRRPAGGFRGRLQRDPRRRTRDQRPSVAVSHRPQSQPNHLRRATAIGVDSMDTHFAENGLSTGEQVMRRESFRQLISDVHQLPETQRSALLLREIDALSYEQIADAMETTVPSVKSLLVRARISLAEAAEAPEAELRGGPSRARSGGGGSDENGSARPPSHARLRALPLPAPAAAGEQPRPRRDHAGGTAAAVQETGLGTDRLDGRAGAGHVAGAGGATAGAGASAGASASLGATAAASAAGASAPAA